MSDVSIPQAVQDLFLAPETILTDEQYNVRGYQINDEEEAKEIEKLAATIERDGQLDSAIITPQKGNTGEYILIAGHRRRRAIVLLNEKKKDGDRLKLRCRVEASGDLYRKAVISNVHRKGSTPMDLALIIKTVREKNGWEGFSGAKKVAGYLNVDLATVTQHEKFLSAPKELQDRLQQGLISADGAFEILNVKPEKREEVLKKAEENQRVQNLRLTPRAKENRKVKGISEEKISQPAITKAIRETRDSTIKPLLLSKKEILEAIEQFDSPAYGYPDGAIRIWAKYFVDTFAIGKGTRETLRKKFDLMTQKAFRGTKLSAEPKPDKSVKVTKKKVVAKKKAKKKSPPDTAE